MSYERQSALVESAWLGERLGAPGLSVIDASWYLPDMKRDPKADYAAGHIPGAVYFDIDEIADTESPFPHMLPRAEKFAASVGALGIGAGDRVVVYDGAGIFSAARVWWMFRVFGHDDVAVLNGGMAKWLAEGGPTENGAVAPTARQFTARLDKGAVRDLGQMLENLGSAREQVVDSRSAGRFTGEVPEPRAGVRSGHIPGSASLPYTTLLDPESHTLLAEDALRGVFDEAGIDMARPVVTSCGSGVTAAVAYLALHLLGHQDLAIYDGSWSEWGSQKDTPVEI